MKQLDRNIEASAPARRNRSNPIGQDSNDAAKQAFLHAGFDDPTIVLHWSEIAGPETAQLATPVRFSEGDGGGTLTLKAEPGAALFLQHEARPLTERINAYLGRAAVVRLRFVQGPLIRRQAHSVTKRVAVPLPPDDPARRFSGPDSVRAALLRLASARLGQAGV